MSWNKNYILAIFVVCMFASSAWSQTSLMGDVSLSVKHETWMAEHQRHYESEEEKEKRLEIFKANVEHIESFNAAGNSTYKLSVNEFADLTDEEFLAKYGSGFNPHFPSNNESSSSFKYEDMKFFDRVPRSIDWRQRGAVSPVKHQQLCGCCWAFSAVAAMEGLVNIRTGEQVPLSEQHVLDCNYLQDDCSGGRADHAFDFVKLNGGLASDTDYPYVGRKRACVNNKPSSLPIRLTGYGYVPSNNEAALLKAVAKQPVAAAIDPHRLPHYRNGVLRGECGNRLTHAVTLVGYGEEGGVKYWLAKNSWGTGWGDGGYFKLERGVAAKEGMCGIAIFATFPKA